jgi:APA family basic amino acid/polyamine antiporter
MLSNQQAEPLTLAMQYANITGLALTIVAFGSVVAHTAVLFVFQLGQPRIFFSMARDGLLPKMFSTVHPRFRTPWGSTILTGVAVGVFSMFTSLDEMVDLTNIGTLFAFILVCLGVIILRVKDPGRERPFRVPGGLVLPILGIIGCFVLIVFLPPSSWLRFAAWLNIGAVIYVCYGSVTSKLTGRAIAEDRNLHDAQTAFTGAWLGVFGILVLGLTRFADVHRAAAERSANWYFESPWWTLTFPLLMNAILLCGAVLLRAKRALNNDIPEPHKSRAKVAMVVGGVLMVLILAYLLCVWQF